MDEEAEMKKYYDLPRRPASGLEVEDKSKARLLLDFVLRMSIKGITASFIDLKQ